MIYYMEIKARQRYLYHGKLEKMSKMIEILLYTCVITWGKNQTTKNYVSYGMVRYTNCDIQYYSLVWWKDMVWSSKRIRATASSICGWCWGCCVPLCVQQTTSIHHPR